MATSQNGWPALSSGSHLLHKWIVPGTDRYFQLRNGSAGFLLCHFILWFHETVQKLNLKGDPWDEWAYAYRPIRGSTGLSNHSSGTAVDLNATKYPMGRHVMKAYNKAKIHARLRLYKGCLRWGGDYSGRVDEMHTEINKDIKTVEQIARRLVNTPRGKRILEANPTQRRIIFS